MSDEIYSVRKQPNGNYTMVKFSDDYVVLAKYELNKLKCNCPQGAKGKHCKHITMLGLFESANHIGDGYFLDFHTRIWRDPIVGDEELDGLTLGNEKPVIIGETQEDRLVKVVAPKLETEGKYDRRPAPQASPIKCEFTMRRRRI